MQLKNQEDPYETIKSLQQKIEMLKESYRKLLDVSNRKKELFDDIPLGEIMINANSVFIGVNEGFEKLLGYTQEELTQMTFYDLLVDEHDIHTTVYQEFKNSGYVKSVIWKMRRKDGTVITVKGNGRAVYNEDGSYKHGRGIYMDITELKHTTEALKQSEIEKEMILDVISDSIIYYDPQLCAIWANKSASEFSGIPAEEIAGKTYLEIFPESEQFFNQYLDEKVKLFTEMLEDEIRTGESTFYMMTVPIYDSNNNHVGIVQVIRDINEKRTLEKKLIEISTNERKNLRNDIHDGLGQVLTGISFLSTALHKNLSEQSSTDASVAAAIVSHSKKALNLMRSTINGLCPVTEDSRGLMTALDQMTTDITTVYNIQTAFQCSGSVRIHEFHLASHLFFIAQEAVNNAAKHSNCKNINITLSENKYGILTLKIQDDGDGLPSDAGNSKGMGLKLMKYRTNLIAGSIDLISSKAGTLIKVSVKNHR